MAALSSVKYRPILSWYSSWLSVLGWLALTGSCPYLAATMIQGLVILNYPEYVAERWHGAMIYWAVLLIALFTNRFLTRSLPMIENFSMFLHVVLFFVIIIGSVVASPTKHTATYVFTTFENSSGWKSNGVSWCIGMLTSAYVMVGKIDVLIQHMLITTLTFLSGADSVMHMAEEMKEPRMGVPRAMVGSLIINAILGFALLVALLFVMGDLDAALSTNTGYPIIEIFYHITSQNRAATTAMTCSIVVAAHLATIGLMMSTSRTMWACARDNLFPASSWLSTLHRTRKVPANCLYITYALLFILGLLIIASTAAFSAFLSLAVASLYMSYLLPMIAMFYRRVWTPEQLTWGPWRINGKLGTVVNFVAICYTLFCIGFVVLPLSQPVSAESMNYASLVLGGSMIFVTIDWFLRGHKTYKGPIVPT
jgi:choline transport protein